MEIVETFIFRRKYFQSLLTFMFFYPKTNNFCNSGMIDHRNLSDLSMHDWDILFHLNCVKCLVIIMPKGQSLKFKASVWNIPISETGCNCNSLFKLVDGNWITFMEQKREMEYSWACTFWAREGFSRFQGFLRWIKL